MLWQDGDTPLDVATQEREEKVLLLLCFASKQVHRRELRKHGLSMQNIGLHMGDRMRSEWI